MSSLLGTTTVHCSDLFIVFINSHIIRENANLIKANAEHECRSLVKATEKVVNFYLLCQWYDLFNREKSVSESIN